MNDVVAATVIPMLAPINQDRLRGLACSPRLPHLLQVNGLFSRLVYECRREREFT